MKSKSDKDMISTKRNNIKLEGLINYMINSCQKPTMKEKILLKISLSIWFVKLKNSKKIAINFIVNGSKNKLSWFMKTTNFKNLKIQLPTYKIKKQSWNKRNHDLTIITELLKEKLKKFKSISKVFNNKWTN